MLECVYDGVNLNTKLADVIFDDKMKNKQHTVYRQQIKKYAEIKNADK